jgi:MFS family permease
VSFFAVRFLLGLAEAGFYPGILLYFTYWFPAATRARILALFCMGIPVSNIVGSPLSGWLLGLELHGLHGWQWMYIVEGVPTLLLGFVALWGLPDSPAKAKWLTPREKEIVLARLAADPKGEVHGLAEMFKDCRSSSWTASSAGALGRLLSLARPAPPRGSVRRWRSCSPGRLVSTAGSASTWWNSPRERPAPLRALP